MQRLLVSDLMRSSSGAIVSQDTPLRDAAEILVTGNLTVLVATDSDDALAGVVAETAVIRQLLATTSHDTTISGILSRHVESVLSEASLYSVLHLFRSACHCVIPVVDRTSQITGLLHRQDVVRLLLSEMEDSETVMPEDSAHTASSQPHFLNRSKLRESQPDRPSTDSADENRG